MPWPSYGNAYSGAPGPNTGNALTTYSRSAGAWAPVGKFARLTGAWRPVRMYPFPPVIEDTTPPPPPTTTVVDISDMVTGSETLSTSVNCTAAFRHAIENVMRRAGPAAAISTDHVTIDFEDTIWRVENSMAFPSDTLINGGLKHVCHRWPKGMKWQNGGIQANSKDGHTSETGGTALTTVDRNRYHIRLQSGMRRPEMANNEQWLEWENFRIQGPLTGSYNYQGEVLPREGQEAVYLAGQQWFRMIDCPIAGQYGDQVFWQERDTTPATGRDNRVVPGMIEVLGGDWGYGGIMNMTINICRPPDAQFAPNWWRSGPDNVDTNGVGYVDQPSLSGQQYGLWWHSNVDHPFTSTDHMRSWIDIEPQGNYSYVGDVRIGSDDNRNNFVIRWVDHPEANDSNTMQFLNWACVRRLTMQHITINGAMNISFNGSPSAVLDATHQATCTLAASEVGGALTGASTTITASATISTGFPAADGRILIPTTVGHTHGRYTTRSGTNFSGVTGAAGTMAAGTIRNASGKRDGCNISAGSNGVTLGAVGSPVGGTGILNVDNHSLPGSGNGMTPTPVYVRVWTTTGCATIRCGPKVGTNQWSGCTVGSADSVGKILRTGQAVTYAYNSPEKIPYSIGAIEIDDIYATVISQSKTQGASQCDGLKWTNCRSPYRTTNTPFSDNTGTIHFDNGVGPEPFGSNNFFLP